MKTKVSLFSKTTAGDMTPLQIVEAAARVSNLAASKQPPGKLLAYLVAHKHFSPLEMVDFTFEIWAPRDITRQILRHRSASFQEFSQRYAEVPEMADNRECRMQDTDNRQNSLENAPQDVADWWYSVQDDMVELADEVYTQALKKGIAKEVARAVLPEGLTMTRMYMKASLRTWLHYIAVRTEAGTQKEHREIAAMIKNILIEEVGHELFKD